MFSKSIVTMLALSFMLSFGGEVYAQNAKTRVLYVGGDWKSQLTNYQGKTPLRGYFVKQEVEKAAPGKFDFTLWTSYEFLQYGDTETLKNFDVLVVGDTMGQSVLPRLIRGVKEFVEGGGGFWYCDNHKAFSFNTKEISFDDVLPIEVVPFRPSDPDMSQPYVASEKDKPLKIQITDAGHPIVKGLAWNEAPALGGARYGKVKEGAKVLAKAPGGQEIWVAWDKAKGRVLWTGGVFANDELSADFSKWNDYGKFCAQILSWLGEHSTAKSIAWKKEIAVGTLTVDPAKKGAEITSKHFGIHGQEDCPGGSYPMQGKDLELYQALNLDGAFARTSAFMGTKKKAGGGDQDIEDDGTDLSKFDASKYDFQKADVVMKDIERIKAEAIFLYWCPWWGPKWPEPKTFTKYFAASIEKINGKPGADYKPRLKYFEIMNEPNLTPSSDVLPRYAEFFNYASSTLREKYPGMLFGCGGFFEWSYVQKVMDLCGKNLDWLSRHPYGHTGEAVFYLQDRYQDYAKSKGIDSLKYIVTEWDFWIYGEPAFDYIMMRWKPMVDRADSCLGSLHYRWREYQEGGYVFGIHGEDFKEKYGELPAEWPNPGKDKPITYRYNAFWAMRDCRGPQLGTKLDVPALNGGIADDSAAYAKRLAEPVERSTRAYTVATCDGKQFNIVVYYGYPYEDPAKSARYGKLKLKIQAPIPAEVKGRTLVVSRSDCRVVSEEAPKPITGDNLDLEIEIPAQSAVSLTVK